MTDSRQWARVGRWTDALRRGLTSLVWLVAERLGLDWGEDPHTVVTFRAIVDAVVPETPELRDELGPEHGPGGLAVGLDEFVITYVDDGFQLGLPYVGPQGNVPMADAVAHVLDVAALKLVDRGGNALEPGRDRAGMLYEPGSPEAARAERAAGMFAKLSREDRLRAIGVLDEVEFRATPFGDELVEFDAGLVGQLVVGFTEMIYYSEWEGYGGFTRPPSDLVHSNDPAAVQSWRQTGYPGVAPGYAALRGYLGTDDGPLGDGESWTTVDGDAASPVRVTRDSGSFRENDYDTGDYEEPYPE
ncbi:MAG: hypothetical protein V5A62_09980 [Haloarculaceae archaeon]